MAARRDRSLTLAPSIHSVVSTRAVDRSRFTDGKPTSRRSLKLAAMRSIWSASRRKSSSCRISARAAALKLLAEAPLHVAVGARGDGVLQSGELGAELLGEEVGHDRDELAHLDEEALQPPDGALDAARVAHVGADRERLGLALR